MVANKPNESAAAERVVKRITIPKGRRAYIISEIDSEGRTVIIIADVPPYKVPA